MDFKISHLTKSYLGENVFYDLNIEIKGHKAIGIIGESGCGKSTLLRQLAGIEIPDTGEIEIDGLSPIKNLKEYRKKIGMVFQKHNLFPHLTIRENITLILHKIKKVDKNTAETITNTLLKKLHIEGEADKKPHEVSGGQAQRASIARALATDPQIIFLDEPTAALDPILTDEVLKAVTELKHEGHGFIFVTHEISFLREFADYIIFLKDGVVCEHGEASLLENPKTKELSEFLKIY